MATDTDTSAVDGFGQVSRTVGTVFRYVLLAATLFGIVVLGILLVYVANDAIQPLTADPGWHLTFFAVLVLPSLVVGGYLAYTNPAALGIGLSVIGLLVVALMFAAGASLIFVDIISPLAWLGVVLATLVPAALVVGIVRLDHRIPFLARLGLTVGLFYLSYFGLFGPLGWQVGLPQVVPRLSAIVVLYVPYIPTRPMTMALTLGLPVALVVGGFFTRANGTRAGRVAAVVAFAVTVAAGVVGPYLGFTPVPATILAAMAVVPTGAYAANVAVNRPDLRVGLLLSAILFGGAYLGAYVVATLGFAGPQSWVDWQFLTSAHSSTAVDAGLYPAIGGSIMLMVVVAVLSFPVGVGAAVYLEEYAPDNRFTRIIDVNISNLAGVPSVVYGLLGLGLLVTYLDQPSGSLFVAGAALGLLILPIVIISSREAIRSVPSDMREASYGMGATRWQTVRNVVLPRAFPGILTGTILALGRAIGETAPLIMVGVASVQYNLPGQLSDKMTAMPMQVYVWASTFASDDFYQRAVPAGVVVLVVVLLAMNSAAIVLRNRYQREN
ncbi:phosphate ABC transporter permease PstA [Halomarina salina]|uniref:Phosphate transport system permease protein PstA n=1 Tax=Halomarina salina TaxID=1872699 RepID=A0ABD5RLH0_9EURY|nr:phosphate ABC transporter permease PstA [Halomarina salina]